MCDNDEKLCELLKQYAKLRRSLNVDDASIESDIKLCFATPPSFTKVNAAQTVPLSKCVIRHYIWMRYTLGIDSQKICTELYNSAAQQEQMAPSLSTVRRWYGLFKSGRESVDDGKRVGRPHKRPLADESINDGAPN